MNTTRCRHSWSIPLLALAAASSGCAYGYAEYEGGGLEASYANPSESPGPPVLRYAIPPEAPKGQAYVISFGVENRNAPDGRPVPPLLHLRIAVENNATLPWSLDPGEATVQFDDAAPIRPRYAMGHQTSGRQTITPGNRGELDVYFAMAAASRPQHASLTWQVHRGLEISTISSRFDLMPGPSSGQVYYEPVYDPALAYAWGPGWWWGPDWYWGIGWGWGAPWWWGGWGWGYHHGGWRGPPIHRGGFGGGMYGGGVQRGGFHGGGGFRGGGFHGGGRR